MIPSKAEEERILSATHLELRRGSVSSGPQTGTHSVSQHSWFSGRRTWSGMLPPTFMTLQHAEDRLLDLSASAITWLIPCNNHILYLNRDNTYKHTYSIDSVSLESSMLNWREFYSNNPALKLFASVLTATPSELHFGCPLPHSCLYLQFHFYFFSIFCWIYWGNIG